MKIRIGFVSNSSSTSFLVMFTKRPRTWEGLHKMMFPNGPVIIDPFGNCPLTSKKITQRVFEDLKGQRPLKRERICEEMSRGRLNVVDVPKFPTGISMLPWEELDKVLSEYEAKLHEFCDDLASEWLEENPYSKVYHFEYCGEGGGFSSTMEHGDIFRNLPHHKISYH